MYEPSFWTVNAWTTHELADKEVKRLHAIARPFWIELQEFEKRYKNDMEEQELITYFDARDALIKKWTDLSGDEGISHLDESEYFITIVEVKA